MPEFYRTDKQSFLPPYYGLPGNIVRFNNYDLDSNLKIVIKDAVDGAGVGNETYYMDLVGQTIPLGTEKCFVKDRIECRGEELYALESDKSLKGYNGRCPKCSYVHARFDKPNYSFYASVNRIHKIYGDKLTDERAKGPKAIDPLLIEKINLPPLDHPITGDNKGIQGDSNSCYMDSTIFCMFAYSRVFDSLLHMKISRNSPVKDLQTLLRENIVNVLRSEKGFVEREFTLRFLFSLNEI